MGILPPNLQEKSIDTLYGDAWRYEDMVAVLDFVQNYPEPYMLSGGDVLYNDLSFSSDWYYDYDLQYDMATNKEKSFRKGIDYIETYVSKIGCNSYFTLTYSRCSQGKNWALARKKADEEAGITKEMRAKSLARRQQMMADIKARENEQTGK